MWSSKFSTISRNSVVRVAWFVYYIVVRRRGKPEGNNRVQWCVGLDKVSCPLKSLPRLDESTTIRTVVISALLVGMTMAIWILLFSTRGFLIVCEKGRVVLLLTSLFIIYLP